MVEVRVDLIVIVARSDGRQGVSLEEALLRTKHLRETASNAGHNSHIILCFGFHSLFDNSLI
jgi:hypothetical protein